MSVDTEVEAPAGAVYELVSDVRRMGQWSPECQRCEWLGGAAGPTPGARFRGHNRIGSRRWSTTATVVVADPGREFAFEVTSLGLPVARWGYRIAGSGDRCTVTEYTQDRRGRLIRMLGLIVTGVSDRADHNRAGMRRTLEAIKQAAESGAAAQAHPAGRVSSAGQRSPG